MTEEQIKQSVTNFLSHSFRGHEVRHTDDIFALGFVNSLFAMQIILFVEKNFNITVESEDLELDNFRSVNAITRFVASKGQITVA